ncbi:MAG: flagellar biosynthetic protein FliO [Roseibium sp.]|nr:flagellar biosynthetic protein FliO [Roseibium sp.]
MYSWIENTFGVGDGLARALAFGVSLGVVLVLFALFVIILKRLMGTPFSGHRNRQPRIAVMDAATVDTRRRLILVRRDNVEHLLLIGGPSDVVVEQGIVRGTPLSVPHQRQAAPLQPQLHLQQGGGVASAPADTDTPGSEAGSAADILRDKAAEADPARIGTAPSRPESVNTDPKEAGYKSGAAPITALRSRFDSRERGTVRGGFAPTDNLPKAEPSISLPQANEAASTNGRASRSMGPVRPETDATVPTGLSAPDPRPDARGQNPSAGAADKALTSRADETSGKSGGTMAGFAKALTRPLSRAARPSPKITPPASGPAARAKTALARAVGSQPDQPRPDASDSTAESPTSTAKLPGPATNDTQTSGHDGVSAPPETPAAAIGGTSMATVKAQPGGSPPAVEPETAKAAPHSNGEPLAEAPPAPQKTEDSGKDSPLEAQPPANADQTLDAGSTEAKSKEPIRPETADAPPEREIKEVATHPAGTKTKQPITPSAPLKTTRTTAPIQQNPIERNPIEEEMAKLLDEIHGPQKT